MKKYLFFISTLIALLFCFASQATVADDVSTHEKALATIVTAADHLCGNVPLTGSSTKTNVTGDVRAELSGLLKKLSDLGVTGKGSINSQQYEGLLQNQLGEALKNLIGCKTHVLDTLVAWVLPGPSVGSPRSGALPVLSKQSADKPCPKGDPDQSGTAVVRTAPNSTVTDLKVNGLRSENYDRSLDLKGKIQGSVRGLDSKTVPTSPRRQFHIDSLYFGTMTPGSTLIVGQNAPAPAGSGCN